jgi:hypothetical protein
MNYLDAFEAARKRDTCSFECLIFADLSNIEGNSLAKGVVVALYKTSQFDGHPPPTAWATSAFKGRSVRRWPDDLRHPGIRIGTRCSPTTRRCTWRRRFEL